MKTITLVPAYGRDYTSKEKAKQAFEDGKDWVISDISNPYNGSYCSIRDIDGYQVKLRYMKRERVVLVNVNDGGCSYEI